MTPCTPSREVYEPLKYIIKNEKTGQYEIRL